MWPQAVVQDCVLHLIRSGFRDAGKADWTELAPDLAPGHSAPTETTAPVTEPLSVGVGKGTGEPPL